jgi:hypothetical protein
MEFFKKYFGADHHVSDQGEMMVCCPFPHKKVDGSVHYDTNPSAGINIEQSLFHCLACGRGYSEAQFLAKIQGVSYADALQILDMEAREKENVWVRYQQALKESPPTLSLLKKLGIDSVIDDLKLGFRGDGILFPVQVYGDILDIRTYNPEGKPKVKSERNAKSLIMPFDLWIKDDRPTLLCAGEKDMAIARVNGFNAITFTGGEMSFPKLFKGSFKDKKIFIIYDNDSAGREGSHKTAALLKEAGAEVCVVTGHYLTCKEQGEDLHDFFQKYGITKEYLQILLDSTEPFSEQDYVKAREAIYPLVSLQEATEGRFANTRIVSSRVAVIATYDDVFHVPDYVSFVKYSQGDKCTVPEGTVFNWALDESNIKDILYLCDSNLKEANVLTNLQKLAGIPPKEPFIRMRKISRTRIFKAVMTDDYEKEIVDTDVKARELTMYSVNKEINSGEKYRIFYKPVTHPLQSQVVVGIITNVEQSDNSVNSFEVTESVIESLKCFQGEVSEKMTESFHRAKEFCGEESQEDIYWTVELFYHTPLQFLFGKRLERAYLEPMLVGESRTGKSQTAKQMLNMLELGVFTSFKTSTIGGLIGGSDKTSSGGFKTKLGLIPRNHKGAVIIEEFSGGGKDFIKQLTDIRSSNRVIIQRVSGTKTALAMVRMLSISNQATGSNGQTIPLKQYPNGIKVLLELIGASEDIARYDFFTIVGKPEEYIYPSDNNPTEAYPKESYMNRVRWIWSRKPEQIVIDQETRNYIIESSKKLNKSYDSHIGFFGAEAWKKLSRVAIASAACTCSMDETGENLIVKKEHVTWAKDFLVRCYDNNLFKLKEYVQHQRQYTECPTTAIPVMQALYDQHTTLIQQMENMTEMSQTQLRNISGLDTTDFGKVMNHLSEFHFITWNGDKVIPSQRFRMALAKISRSNYVAKVGSEQSD